MVLVIKVWPYLKRSIFLQKESCGNNTGIQACKPIAQEVWPLWVMFENATRDSSMICRHSAPSTQFGNILKHSESRSPTWGQQTSGWRGRTIFSTSHIKKSLTQNSILRAATGWGRGESLNKRGGGGVLIWGGRKQQVPSAAVQISLANVIRQLHLQSPKGVIYITAREFKGVTAT